MEKKQHQPKEHALQSLISMDSIDIFGSPHATARMDRPGSARLQLGAGRSASSEGAASGTTVSEAAHKVRSKEAQGKGSAVTQDGSRPKSPAAIPIGVSKGIKKTDGKGAATGAQAGEKQASPMKASRGTKAAAGFAIEAASGSGTPRVPIWEKQPVWRQASLEGAPPAAASSSPRSDTGRQSASPRQQDSYLARRPRDSSLKMRAKVREAGFNPSRTSSLAPAGTLARDNSALGADYATAQATVPPALQEPAAKDTQPDGVKEEGVASAAETAHKAEEAAGTPAGASVHVVVPASDNSEAKQEQPATNGSSLHEAAVSEGKAAAAGAAAQPAEQREKLTLEQAWARAKQPLSPVKKKLPKVKVKTKSGNSDVPEQMRARQSCSVFACFRG